MQSVGYDMYCKLLAEAVRARKGEETVPDYETQIDLDVDAYIPDGYILNEMQKLDIYKRIALITTPAEYADMQDELKDRFGEVPKSADNLLRIALLKADAHALGVSQIKGGNGRIVIEMREDAPIRVEGIPEALSVGAGRLGFSPKGTPTFTYRYDASALVEQAEEDLLAASEHVIRECFAPLSM